MRKFFITVALSAILVAGLVGCSPTNNLIDEWVTEVEKIPGVTSAVYSNTDNSDALPELTVNILAQEKYYPEIQTQLCKAENKLENSMPITLTISEENKKSKVNVFTKTTCPQVFNSYARIWRTTNRVLPESQLNIYPQTNTYSICEDCDVPLQQEEINVLLMGIIPEIKDPFVFKTKVAASYTPQTPVPVTFDGNKAEAQDLLRVLRYLETPIDAPREITVKNGTMEISYYSSTITQKELENTQTEIQNIVQTLTIETNTDK